MGKWDKILAVVIVAAIVAAGYAAWQRHVLESQNRTVAMAVVYSEVVSLARMNGLETAEILGMFGDKGVRQVLIKECTVEEAATNGDFVVRTGRELLHLPAPDLASLMGADWREAVKPAHRYFIFDDAETYNRVQRHFKAKGVIMRAWRGQGRYLVETGHDWSYLRKLGIGFPGRAVADVRETGLGALVQVRSWGQVTATGLREVFGELEEIPNLEGVLFNDPVLPGVPGQIRTLAAEVDKLGVPVVRVEFTNQVGFTKLGLLLDKDVLRLHTLTTEEDAKRNYSFAAMVDRFSLAAAERNNRVLLLHIYMKTGEPDLLQAHLDLVTGLGAALAGEGLTVGKPSVFPPLEVSRVLLFIMGLGVIAGGMLLAFRLGWRRPALYLGGAGLLLWTGLLAADMVNPARKLMAFAAVVIFPTLALALNVPREGASPGRGVLLLLRASLLSLVGALFMVGLLADVGFMLKLDQFTGVKLAHVAPLGLLAAIFFFRGDGTGLPWRERLQKFMDQPILVKFAIAAGVLFIVLVIYVSRTGNESAAVSSLELKFRALLDNLLGVRPRTKEFLLGHPLLLLLFYLGFRDNRYQPLLLAGAIGQISLVNTFAHIHTPLLISLARSFNGLWLGVLGGLALIVLWRAGAWYVNNYHQGTSRR
ncbi:MAG: DUF5693 family protein [Firmicutes bacterium]|nr:DUF5693 family protein [Bacillota bacterium]